MIVTVASFKGGVGKTTSAVHLAAYLQQQSPALLVDGDPNRSATGWARRGGLPFQVVDERQAARYARQFEHIVIDTEARPEEEDLKALADGCDLLVVPCTPDALAMDALLQTVEALQALGAGRYRVLLTMVPPFPSRDGEQARADLGNNGLPLFRAEIPRAAAVPKAALAGVTLAELRGDPRASIIWDRYEAVGREIGEQVR